MKKILILLSIVIAVVSVNSVKAQFDWDKISYTHSSGSNSDNSKVYYIIDIDNKGNGKLEYFKAGKPEIKEFKISKKTLNFLNEKIRKTGIYKIDPKDLISDKIVNNEYIYTMTLTLEREFGEEYNYKIEEKKKPGKDDKDSDEQEKVEDESEKPQVIPVPNNLKLNYRKDFYNLYYDIEMSVPVRVWKEVGVE